MAFATTSMNWNDWTGGEMPVPKGTLVQVRLRHGKEHAAEAGEGYATRWTWMRSGDGQFNDVEVDRSDGYDDIVAYRLLTPFTPTPQVNTVLSSTNGADCRPAHCTSPSTVSRYALNDCANGNKPGRNCHYARRDLLPERKGEVLLDRENMSVPIEHSLAIDPKIAQLVYPNHPNAIRPVLWICHIQRHIVQRSLSFIFAISHRLILSIVRTRIIPTVQFAKAPTPSPREELKP